MGAFCRASGEWFLNLSPPQCFIDQACVSGFPSSQILSSAAFPRSLQFSADGCGFAAGFNILCSAAGGGNTTPHSTQPFVLRHSRSSSRGPFPPFLHAADFPCHCSLASLWTAFTVLCAARRRSNFALKMLAVNLDRTAKFKAFLFNVPNTKVSIPEGKLEACDDSWH